MTDSVVVALIVAGASVVNATISLLNGQKLNGVKVDVAGVHEAVNGGLAAAKAEIRTAHQEIRTLKATLRQLETRNGITE
jgi:hypothetical protein